MDQHSHTRSPMGRRADPGDPGPRPGRHGLRRPAPPSASLCLSCPREGSRWPLLHSPRHRQRETAQAELSAQELEEPILLAEMATLQVCPRCQTRVEFDFIVCPCCHQELKRPCPRCVRLLELGWICCPYCALQLGAGSMPPGVPGTLAAQGAPGHVGVGAHAISGRRNEETGTGEGETGGE